MPLDKKPTRAAREKNIHTLIQEGRPPKQAVAIAYSEQRRAERRPARSRGGRRR